MSKWFKHIVTWKMVTTVDDNPTVDGDYYVLVKPGIIMKVHYTTLYGWNTHLTCPESAFEQEDILAYCQISSFDCLFVRVDNDIKLSPDIRAVELDD